MKQTLDEGGGYLDLELLLTFNRVKAWCLGRKCSLRHGFCLGHYHRCAPQALGVSDVGQLVDAARSSELLQLNAECTKVRLVVLVKAASLPGMGS